MHGPKIINYKTMQFPNENIYEIVQYIIKMYVMHYKMYNGSYYYLLLKLIFLKELLQSTGDGQCKL